MVLFGRLGLCSCHDRAVAEALNAALQQLLPAVVIFAALSKVERLMPNFFSKGSCFRKDLVEKGHWD